MKDTYTNPPGEAGDSWANEKLPMRVRRELLDREIRQLIDGNAHAQAEDAGAAPPQRPPKSDSPHG